MRKSDDLYLPYEPSADIAAAVAFGIARPGSRVLEMGCSNGDDALFLAQAGCQVKAYDLSKVSIAYARSHRKVLEMRFGQRLRCAFSHGGHRDVMRLARAGRVFDLVSDRLVFSNMRDRRVYMPYLEAVAGLIRRGGLFFLRVGTADTPTGEALEVTGFVTIMRRLFEPVDLLEEMRTMRRGPTRRTLGYDASVKETSKPASKRVQGRWMPMLPHRGDNSRSALVFLLRARSVKKK